MYRIHRFNFLLFLISTHFILLFKRKETIPTFKSIQFNIYYNFVVVTKRTFIIRLNCLDFVKIIALIDRFINYFMLLRLQLFFLLPETEIFPTELPEQITLSDSAM